MPQLLKGIGKQLQIGIAKESTRGTAKTTASYWLPVDDWEVEERFENAVDSQTYGIIEDNVGQTRVKNWSEGSLKMPLTGTSSAVLFLALFGTTTSVLRSGQDKIFDNTINIGQSVQHPSLTVFVHDPIPTASGTSADYAHANAIVHKIDIDYSLGNFVMMTAELRAQKGVAAAAAYTPSQSVETRYVPQYLTFKVASTFAGLTAASAIKIKSASISINENPEDDDVLGQTAPRDFVNKEFSIEGTVEAIWQNESDFKVAALANTPQAMRFDLVNSDILEGRSGGINPQFRLDLARVHFTEFSRPIKIKDIVYQTISFKAAYSVSDALMARILIVNSVKLENV